MYRVLWLLAIAFAAFPAERGGWSALRSVAPGAAVEARREDGAKFRGTLTRVTENQIVIGCKGGPVTLGRSTVRAVGVKQSRRGLSVAFGWLMPGYKTVYNAPHARKKR